MSNTVDKDAIVKQINVFDVLGKMWANKKSYIKVCCLCGIFGLIVAFLIPKQYEANVILAPEVSSEGLKGGLSSLASLANIDLGEEANEAIHLSIYPAVLASTPFIEDLLSTEVLTSDGDSISFEKFLMVRQRMAIWNYPMYYLGVMIRSIANPKDITVSSDDGAEPEFMCYSKKKLSIIETVKDILQCDIDKENGMITISVQTQDPLVCAQMANEAQKKLQKYIIEYRTKKAAGDVEYYTALKQETMQDYANSQMAYAKVADADVDIVLHVVRNEVETLEREMQMRYETYSRVSGQLDMAKAKLQERMPSFVLVQPSIVPLKPVAPRKLVIMVIWAILGFLGVSVKVFWRDMLSALRSTETISK